MEKVLLIIVLGLLLLAGLYTLARNSHKRWLLQQTPVGTWKATTGDTETILQFELGPQEGSYKQLTVTDGQRVREFGSWHACLNDLQMLIMATDTPQHPRFGINTHHTIRYVGPDSIRIDGPDRENLLWERSTSTLPPDFDRAGTSAAE